MGAYVSGYSHAGMEGLSRQLLAVGRRQKLIQMKSFVERYLQQTKATSTNMEQNHFTFEVGLQRSTFYNFNVLHTHTTCRTVAYSSS